MRIVQKYGGTSVGSVERIRSCAERIARARAEDHQILVVVSAMGGETDRLMGLANAITRGHMAHALAMVLYGAEPGAQVDVTDGRELSWPNFNALKSHSPQLEESVLDCSGLCVKQDYKQTFRPDTVLVN